MRRYMSYIRISKETEYEWKEDNGFLWMLNIILLFPCEGQCMRFNLSFTPAADNRSRVISVF